VQADFPVQFSGSLGHDVYCRIKAEVAFGWDVESATLIAAKRPTLINFNAVAIASLG
jgi:hypothetical protein